MSTNRKSYFLRFFTLIYVLFISSSVFSQSNIVKHILDADGGIWRGSVKISLQTDEGTIDKDVSKDSPLPSDATINVLSSNFTLVLETINKTLIEIPGKTILNFNITNDSEDYTLLKIDSNKNVVLKELEAYLGSVTVNGIKNRVEALTVGTIFTFSLTNDNLQVKLRDGKLDLNHLKDRKISDNTVIGNDSLRSIFINTNRLLSVKDGIYPNLKSVINPPPNLESDKGIRKFLNKHRIIQKKGLVKMGEYSKKSIKKLEKEDSVEEAILSFDRAIIENELTIDLIVQSAFLFADSYLFNNDIKKSRAWLELGIHYSELLYKTKDKFLENNDNLDLNSNDIDNSITKSLMYDMVTVNEFRAWGYDIKLKLNGCLENPRENPSKYRANANALLNKIQQNKLKK